MPWLRRDEEINARVETRGSRSGFTGRRYCPKNHFRKSISVENCNISLRNNTLISKRRCEKILSRSVLQTGRAFNQMLLSVSILVVGSVKSFMKTGEASMKPRRALRNARGKPKYRVTISQKDTLCTHDLTGRKKNERGFSEEVTEREEDPEMHLLSPFKMFSVDSVV